jgi:hypothetical protein
VLWTGAPRQGVFFGTADVVGAGFGAFFALIVWRSLRSFGELSAIDYALFSSPFTVFIVHWIAVRFFFDPRRRARTRYVVTNQRIVISLPRHVDAIELTNLERVGAWVKGRGLIEDGGLRIPTLRRLPSQAADGSGDIIFSPARATRTRNAGFATRGLPRFESVAPVEQVLELIERARADAGPRPLDIHRNPCDITELGRAGPPSTPSTVADDGNR